LIVVGELGLVLGHNIGFGGFHLEHFACTFHLAAMG